MKFPAFYGIWKFITAFTRAHHLNPILSQIDPVHTSIFHFLKVYLNIVLPSTLGSPKWPLSLTFPHLTSVYASPLPHTRYVTHPSHSSRFYHPKSNWWAVQIIKLLIMYFSPFPRYLVPLSPKHITNRTIFGEEYRSLSSSLCSFLHSRSLTYNFYVFKFHILTFWRRNYFF